MTTTPLNYQTHPQAIYTSRLLNFSKFPKPKNEENFGRELEELTESMSLVELNTDPSNKIITKSNIPAQIFEIILKGINDTENMDTITMYDLMVVANELEFEELSEKLENHLIQSKASWLRTHFTFIYHVIFKHNKFKNLKNFCNNIIVKQPRIIFESAEFSSLYESALVSILKCDDLQMNEKEIWDYVIKWEQHKILLYPRKWKNATSYTARSPVKSIILPQSYSLTNNSYVSQLLLQGSKDGFAPRTFWDICNRHNNIGIAKVERTNKIIGFNPLAWNKTKEGWVKTNKDFILSFKGGNIQNSILSEVKNETYTLRYPYYNKR
ncbi:hypothetical protein Glove_266g18 [Diversispora epigaea]|uniref:BACK domain-containing protein n=1 Tax=Diversispora epigaea TaxID=1348612 RepID=A0A397IAL0_9GLOM|nr:hypothetical protein Glove_266g18 [Diversispora epigaea]